MISFAGTSLLAAWVLATPLMFLILGLLAPRRASLAGLLGIALALSAAVATHRAGPAAGAVGPLSVRLDNVTSVMLVLIATLGWVVTRYSVTYLESDAALPRYLRWLLFTLGAVTLLASSNDLLVVALAWTATSMTLHPLLTHYGERTAAQVAAHKKFLLSRAADGCLLVALALLHRAVGSLHFDHIAAWAEAHPALTPGAHVAAVLLVVAVALRCAQVPFHGWLTQVMEAPTPVSALLHAGVVNIGGLVLIRLAPLLSQATPALVLLLLVGATSAAAGTLVMTTRVSIKVALAWSTCAQLGFMLVQCALGAWHLALLHLVAHSVYKAHAFLSAGSTVDVWREQALAKRPHVVGLRIASCVTALLAGGALVVVVVTQAGWVGGAETVPFAVLTALASLSLVPTFASNTIGHARTAFALLRGLGVIGLYVAGHAVARATMPAERAPHGLGAIAWLVAGVAFALLFALKTALALAPQGRLARVIYPPLFAGFYFDDRITRLTFRLWPPRLPVNAAAHARLPFKPKKALA